ncbi:Uncharacterised protein r2_g2116 [Pycnogonum litorale]
MKISVTKTEILLLSRRPGQCALHVSEVPPKRVEKFEYLGVVFTSDGGHDVELDTRIAAAGAVMRQLQRSVLLRRQLGVKAKLAVFKSVFVPILTYGHEPWVMTEIMRSRIRAAEMAVSGQLDLRCSIGCVLRRLSRAPDRKITAPILWTCDAGVFRQTC